MSDTKTKILDTALVLFNEQGFSNVSLRDIGKAINMQPGNLAYHFKNTGVMLEKLYDRMYAEMEQVIRPSGFPDMQRFDAGLRYFYDFQYRYRFFFLDLVEITRKHPEIATRHQETVQKRIGEGTALLYYYAGAGLIGPEGCPGQFEARAHLIWMIHTFWLAQQRLLSPDSDYDPEPARRAAWEILRPHLTEAGKKTCEALLKP